MQAAETTTVHELAGEAYDQFEVRERADGGDYTASKDGASEWLGDLVRDAHGDFLPDDWRYDAIRGALGDIHDAGEGADLDDLAHEFADGGSVYTGEQLAWLASNLTRQGYCDEYQSEGLAPENASVTQLVAGGMYMERLEVFGLVLQGLRARADELAE